MKTTLSALAVAVAVLVPLNAATFTYVVSIERRLTRLETVQELTRKSKGVVLTRREAVAHGAQQGLKVLCAVERIAAGEAERADCLGALWPLHPAPVVAHEVGSVQDGGDVRRAAYGSVHGAAILPTAQQRERESSCRCAAFLVR